MKLYRAKEKGLENFTLNFLYTFFYYNTIPFRTSLGKTFSPWLCDRTWFLLEALDEKGNNIYPENFNPIGYRDDILYILTAFFGIFALVMGCSYIRGVKNGKLYIDKLKDNRTKMADRLIT